MPSGSFCGLRPLLFGRKVSRFEQMKSAHLPKSPAMKQKESNMERPRVFTGNFILMMELRKKIIIFRDVVDLPPHEGSVSVNELVIGTLKDLHRFYPEIITRNQLSEMKRQTLNKVLFYFCESLKTIGDSWMVNSEWMDEATLNMFNNNEHHNSERIVEISLATLDCMIKIPKETFDRMDVDEEEDEDDRISYSPLNSAFNKLAARSCSGSPTSCCASPVTPTSVLPEYPGSPGLEAFANISGSSPLLRSLRAQALGKLNPIDIKRLLFHMQSDMGSHVGCSVSKKNAVEDERQEEMEAKCESLHQSNNIGNELMFEMTMEASTVPEMKEDENLESSRSSTAKPDGANVISGNPEATELLTRTPQVSPNAGAASSPGLIVSAEVIQADGKSVSPPSTIMTSQPNDEMQLPASKSAPPPPPLPSPLIARQSVEPVHRTLPPLPPPPPPALVVSVASLTKSERHQPILQLNVTANGVSLQMPPTSPELPMSSITETTAAMLPAPPPPPPLPMKIGTSTTKPLPPPLPPASPMQLETSTITRPPPLPPNMQLSQQTTILKLSAPSIKQENLRMQPPPPPPPPPMQLATMSKTLSIPPLPMQLGSQATLRSQPPLPLPPPPPPLPPPMQSRTITTMTMPPQPQMSTSAIAAPPSPHPPPPMMSSKGTNAMVTLSSAPLPPQISSNVPNATRGATPQPPPPMMSSNGARAAPPPPPMMPSKGSSAIGGPPPPPPPMMSSKGTMPPPPPIPFGNGVAAPPPPPPGATRSLRPKKAQTKLKRSTQIGNLYRVLKGKVEGVKQNHRSNNGRKGSAASSAGGKQGMADALAEMTKRSAYFQQIEEDVRKYTKSILELKTSISTFQTKDMSELIEFHSHVESILENLADETQVLARFEGFPQKKLEALRMAVALHSKLNGIIVELHNWKIEAPLSQLLERTERYFCKIKGEIESLERTKDEESKKFQAHNIHFDFHILVQIKEAMVDVSSNCMELALKERRDAAETGQKPGHKKACVKMLWKAFQFAFKVYSFAGGHDDRADKLTRELAHEIETDPQHQE